MRILYIVNNLVNRSARCSVELQMADLRPAERVAKAVCSDESVQTELWINNKIDSVFHGFRPVFM